MPRQSPAITPSLATYLKTVRSERVEKSIEELISLLKRRQICNSRPCAIATAYLLRRVVTQFRVADIDQLITRVQQVGKRLTAAQPREIAVGNIVRRVLGIIRDEAEEDREGERSSDANTDSRPLSRDEQAQAQRPGLSSSISTFSPLKRSGMELTDLSNIIRSPDESFASIPEESPNRPPLLTSHTSYAVNNTAPMVTSMFSLLSHPASSYQTPTSSPGTQSPTTKPLTSQSLSRLSASIKDLKDEILSSIEELIDELNQVDDQIAAYALDHIHANEIILTHTSSVTVQKFLLKAAAKRTFTVIHAETYPNNHHATHSTVAGHSGRKSGAGESTDEDYLPSADYVKPLTQAGITVILIPDSAVFALMSRVNKVILGTHVVLANGGLVAVLGTKTIALAARAHKTPVVVVSGVYKLSPIYPFDFDSLIEQGDSGNVVRYQEGGELVDERVDVLNPMFDYVPAELVDLYVTNLGGHAPSYLYRVVEDHYRKEDLEALRT
ncbi:GCD complex subunit gcd7 [Agyrium rufum]|nr:GCD complex subunit gcd7 [Agyrium rufum]